MKICRAKDIDTTVDAAQIAAQERTAAQEVLTTLQGYVSRTNADKNRPVIIFPHCSFLWSFELFHLDWLTMCHCFSVWVGDYWGGFVVCPARLNQDGAARSGYTMQGCHMLQSVSRPESLCDAAGERQYAQDHSSHRRRCERCQYDSGCSYWSRNPRTRGHAGCSGLRLHHFTISIPREAHHGPWQVTKTWPCRILSHAVCLKESGATAESPPSYATSSTRMSRLPCRCFGSVVLQPSVASLSMMICTRFDFFFLDAALFAIASVWGSSF